MNLLNGSIPSGLRRHGLLSFFAILLLTFFSIHATAQQSEQLRGHVVDIAGYPVVHAAISVDGVTETHTDGAGDFAMPWTSSNVTVTASYNGLQATLKVTVSRQVVLVLRPAAIQETASVTATRSTGGPGITTSTVSTIDQAGLTQYPALALDERLRQHAGFELFRRSSSWVANPTSEGISLRGLGSTAASRTLVLSDLVPLNDGFGGWIHWNEIPPPAIEAVTLASGGGSDLYGSSALGGVIDVVPVHPGPLLGDADLAAASEDTTSYDARVDVRQSRWSELLATQLFRTAGYTIVAPAVRGPVDIPANVHYQTGRTEIDRTFRGDNRAWVTGNVLNEAHNNGTPIQTNGTRLWRYFAGDDWTASSRVSGRARGFGSDEAYRQTFSSINATRSVENLTRLQKVGTQEFGGSTDASIHFERVAFVSGADLRDLRATDLETPYTGGLPSGLQNTTARQRFYGGFGEMLGERNGWSGTASLRADEAQNLATDTIMQSATAAPSDTPTPDRHELVFNPRVGIAKQLATNVSLHASAFRAFRTPTMNELYRTGQVGSLVTRPNSGLLSERATGAEAGADWATPNKFLDVQATYFWTEINRPVSAVLLSGTTYKRENLGQIQSQGVALNAQLQPAHNLSLAFGYQYAHAVVTAFSSQPQFVGLWIPEVPRNSATAQLRYQRGRGAYTLAAREIGRAFDDSANTYELHSFFVLDAYGETRVHSHVSLYVSLQNLLNRSIETARTPNLTLGTPFVTQGGVRLNWKRE